jgi:hypothetical protein
MTENVLKFKLEFDKKEEITPYAGLGLYGELYKGMGIEKEIKKIFPTPGSGKGYEANEYIKPLVLMFIGGGEHIEDIRKIKADKGLRQICKMEVVPSGDAIGDWVRRDSRKKIEDIKIIQENISRRILKKEERQEYTLDMDATGIEAQKQTAAYTYKGYKGYMPMLGFLSEIDWCIGYEFREGNESPAGRNYEFLKGVVAFVETTGKRIGRVRIDAAGYQSKVMNYAHRKGVRYTITADQDVAVKRAIKGIEAEGWKEWRDSDGIKTGREYGETIHSMNETDHAFRLVVERWANPQRDLFEQREEYCYHVIATDYLEEEKSGEDVIWWHNGRGNAENYNKEIKGGFHLGSMPSGGFEGNGVWFGIGILAYTLFIASKMYLFPKSWKKKTIGTVRWQFIQMAGKLIRRSRYIVLKVCSVMREIFDIYQEARQRCWELRMNL